MKPKTKKSFREATALKYIWNNIVEWNGLKLATVLWQANKEWKVVNSTLRIGKIDFDLIADRQNKDYIIAEFHTQEELWQYIIDNKLNY